MKKLNRKKTPHALPLEDIRFLKAEKYELKNGIPVYQINSGVQNIVKLELIFESGHWNCNNSLLADFTNQMLIEGSSKFNSSEIAEKFDYFGAFTNFECGKHFASVQLYCLSNFAEKSIEVLETYVKSPIFPEKEFKVHLKNEYQQFTLSREKTEILAAEEFYKKLFGENHPYGMLRQTEEYENLKIEQLKEHHQRYYNPANCKIIVSGKLEPKLIKFLDKHFGNEDWQKGEKVPEQKFKLKNGRPERFIIKKEGAVQASLRIGKVTVNKKDADFYGLSILNTILGGYFGSRLMTNLREKNALTYGVYSNLSSLLHAGVFSISANVNPAQIENAIEQITKEISILRNELIPREELDMVKNYLSGEMLKVFDGPLPVSEIYAELLNYGLDFSFYRSYLETLKSIEPKTLRELANKYLNKDSFTEIVVGNF